MKSETAEKFKRRVDVLINAVYNKNTKLKETFEMKAKIYEGRIYSVMKEKDGNIVSRQWKECTRMMQISKRQ